MAKKTRIPHKFQPWIDVRKKYVLSHAHIQMARELGLSPKNFGKLVKTEKQPWKKPLPEFIESQYERRFGKTQPDVVQTIEQLAAAHLEKRAEKKAAKLEASQQELEAKEVAEPET
jgi:hypothetical protein